MVGLARHLLSGRLLIKITVCAAIFRVIGIVARCEAVVLNKMEWTCRPLVEPFYQSRDGLFLLSRARQSKVEVGILWDYQ